MPQSTSVIAPNLTTSILSAPVSKTGILASLPSKRVIILASILGVLQILDGVLTGIGVANLGTQAEGNILLRTLMEVVGFIPALIIFKSAAIGIVGALANLSKTIKWVAPAFVVMIGIYFTAAVLPWTAILLLHFSGQA